MAFEIAQLVTEGELTKVFLDPEIGLEFGGEWRQSFSANTKTGRRRNPTPSNPALLTHFQTILDKMQPVVAKRSVVTPDQIPRPPNLNFNNLQSSYAARASSTTYTSTTHSDTNTRNTPGTRQTKTQSVVVIEKYEERFVHMESRLTVVDAQLEI